MARAEPRTKFDIGGRSVRPGRQESFEIGVSRLPTGHEVYLPMRVMHGRNAGPTLWLSAAIHGDELNGVEIVRRVMKSLDPKQLAGTIIALPLVNPFGFLQQSRYLPDRRDLNRSFPGSPRGSLAARIAHLFMTEVVQHCQYGIDLHTGSGGRTNLPQIRADLDCADTLELVRAFAPPVALHSALRDGSLRAAAVKQGAKVMLFEGGEALRLSEGAIVAGVQGVRRTLAMLGMCPARPEDAPASDVLTVSRDTNWVRAARSGLFVRKAQLGARLEAGDRIGLLVAPTSNSVHIVKAKEPGILIGLATNPQVHRGDALAHVAVVPQTG